MGDKQRCCDKSKNIEDGPIEIPAGMLPDTLTFKCPGKMCQPKQQEEETKPVDKCAMRQMPKTDTSKCPTKKTAGADQCQPPPEEKKSDSAPKIADQCAPPEKDENENCNCEEEKPQQKCPEYNTEKAPCGTSLSSNTGPNPNCNCSRPVAPRPRPQIPAGCGPKSANCGPNTACIVQPLTMSKKKD